MWLEAVAAATVGPAHRPRAYQVDGRVVDYRAYDGCGELGFDSAEKA